jgi:hypothetical protein
MSCVAIHFTKSVGEEEDCAERKHERDQQCAEGCEPGALCSAWPLEKPPQVHRQKKRNTQPSDRAKGDWPVSPAPFRPGQEEPQRAYRCTSTSEQQESDSGILAQGGSWRARRPWWAIHEEALVLAGAVAFRDYSYVQPTSANPGLASRTVRSPQRRHVAEGRDRHEWCFFAAANRQGPSCIVDSGLSVPPQWAPSSLRTR